MTDKGLHCPQSDLFLSATKTGQLILNPLPNEHSSLPSPLPNWDTLNPALPQLDTQQGKAGKNPLFINLAFFPPSPVPLPWKNQVNSLYPFLENEYKVSQAYNPFCTHSFSNLSLPGKKYPTFTPAMSSSFPFTTSLPNSAQSKKIKVR